jgi:23S rRNA-/tRNA-specific pseudouridylate synthase
LSSEWGAIHLCTALAYLWFVFLFVSFRNRFHQLNVHCAAMGNPIVGDTVYGINGAAAANGGLDEPTSASKASAEAQEAIATGSAGKSPCVHAKSLAFEHPASRDDLSFESAAPF